MAGQIFQDRTFPIPNVYEPKKKLPLSERFMNLAGKLFAVGLVILGLSVFTIFAVGLVGICLKWTIGWFK